MVFYMVWLLVAIGCLVIFLSWCYSNSLKCGYLPYLSFLLVVQNQENNIEGMMRILRRLRYCRPFEIVVVDNASSDQTRDILVRLYYRYQDFTLVTLQERGAGEALFEGCNYCSERLFIVGICGMIIPGLLFRKSPGYLVNDVYHRFSCVKKITAAGRAVKSAKY